MIHRDGPMFHVMRRYSADQLSFCGPDGETGRRSGLKIRRPLNGAYRFEPGSGHHKAGVEFGSAVDKAAVVLLSLFDVASDNQAALHDVK